MPRCLTPISIYNPKAGGYMEAPCSRCWNCLTRRADAWAFRIMQERKRATSAHFITLTYDTEHVPINQETMTFTLDKKAIPGYMKRLRKLHTQAYKHINKNKWKIQPLKYYAVGEYGENFERPHYHIILFNAIKELIPLSWSINGKMLGLVDIGKKGVTAGGARYLCQYMLTGLDQNFDNRQKPFSLMSKGLGNNYITEAIKKWHLQTTGKSVINNKGEIIKTRDRYYAIQDGYKIALPRYYRDKIFPKIYREIDLPNIVGELTEKEDILARKDITAYVRNIDGLIQTGINIKDKKAKQKNRIGGLSEAHGSIIF